MYKMLSSEEILMTGKTYVDTAIELHQPSHKHYDSQAYLHKGNTLIDMLNSFKCKCGNCQSEWVWFHDLWQLEDVYQCDGEVRWSIIADFRQNDNIYMQCYQCGHTERVWEYGKDSINTSCLFEQLSQRGQEQIND